MMTNLRRKIDLHITWTRILYRIHRRQGKSPLQAARIAVQRKMH